jgi:hypothetical protein
MNITTSEYYIANKKEIKQNWKKEFIKANHNFSLLEYINFYVEHMKSLNLIEDTRISYSYIMKDMYKTI